MSRRHEKSVKPIPIPGRGGGPIAEQQILVNATGNAQEAPQTDNTVDANVREPFENREFQRLFAKFFMDHMHGSHRSSIENSDASPPSYQQA